MKAHKADNYPNIPKPTEVEQLRIDNEELSKAISRIKYYVPTVKEFLTEAQLEIVKKYAP